MKPKPQIRTTALGYVVAVVPIMGETTQANEPYVSTEYTYMVVGIAPNGHVTYYTSPFPSKSKADAHRRELVALHRELRAKTRARSEARTKKAKA
jgi:hypothetical protein